MTSKLPYNFAPGPAVLPEPVLEKAAEQMLSWGGSGMSVMEMTHRGPLFTGIHEQAIADLKELLGLDDDFEVLFMQGGATAQNAIVPMNLLAKNSKADFVHTGHWSAKSIAETKKYGDSNVVATAEPEWGGGRKLWLCAARLAVVASWAGGLPSYLWKRDHWRGRVPPVA